MTAQPESIQYQFGIFQKMLLTMLLVSLVPLVAIWYIDHQSSLNQLTNNVNQLLDNTSDKLVSHVNTWVTMNVKVLNQNAQLDSMRSMDATKQNPILRSILNEYEWSYLVFTMNSSGINVGRSDGKPVKNYSDRSYFKRVMAGDTLGKQVLIGRTTNEPALILSVPIRKRNRVLVGVIAIAMSIKEMSEQITNLKIGKTGFAFMLDENGKVVAHQKPEFANTSADFSKSPAFINRPQNGEKLITYMDNGKKVVAYIETTEQGWLMVTQQDFDEAFARIVEANTRSAIILGLTFLLVSIIAYIFAQRLTQPIRTLTHLAEEMSRGKSFEKIEETKRNDELGALALAIERMGVSIQMAIKRLKRKT